MPSGSRFKNSWSRLERARLQLKTFESEWTSLFKGERQTSLACDGEHPGWWTVGVDLSPDCIARIKSNQLSLILGEIAYQLRAALDGLIWDMVTLTQGAEPSSDAKSLHRLEFPLSTGWKATDVDDDRFHGFPFPQKLIEWMRSIQPGTAEKPVGHPDYGLSNTLEDIHDLARHDRHRRLRLMSMVPLSRSSVRLLGTDPAGGKVVGYEWLKSDPLNGKYELVRLKILCPGNLIPYKVNLKTNLAFTIAAEDVEPYGGGDFGFQIDRFISAVEHVIRRFGAGVY